MIHVVIYQNEKEECTGFQTEGHAEYADPGQDVYKRQWQELRLQR